MKRDQAAKCSPQFVVDSQLTLERLQDLPLAEAQGLDDPIQLKPQRVSMRNARNGRT